MTQTAPRKNQKSATEKSFLRVLGGDVLTPPPFWLMRQAGRYLPEYREIRARAGNFLDLVYNPELAVEVTMQPLRRFDMDAAIIFSDILVIPQALGQDLKFTQGEGPRLNPILNAEDLSALEKNLAMDKLSPVYQAISQTAEKMIEEGFDQTALIGFSGAPWTLACYMVDGKGGTGFPKAQEWAKEDPQNFAALINILIHAVADHLSAQIEAGAEAVQIFDSWAGYLDGADFDRWVTQPAAEVVRKLREKYPNIPVIGFPKGAGPNYLPYAKETGINALSLDTNVPLEWAAEVLQPHVTLQGNLDPEILLSGENLEKETINILKTLGNGPFIFNLGHGVIKETPPEHVEKLAAIIKAYQG